MAITRYILQIHCPDQKGLIAGTTQVLAKAGANIVDLQQHTAKDIETFFLRAVFEAESENIEEVRKHLQTLEGHLHLNWKLFDTTKIERVAIFVSKTTTAFTTFCSRDAMETSPASSVALWVTTPTWAPWAAPSAYRSTMCRRTRTRAFPRTVSAKSSPRPAPTRSSSPDTCRY